MVKIIGLINTSSAMKIRLKIPCLTLFILIFLSGIEVKAQLQNCLDKWAFQYKYDARKRMTHKKVPGADWVYMVYDKRDRLVLTQDGNQRLSNSWSFTKYDELDRPISTGIKDTSVALTQVQMQDAVNLHYTKVSAKWGETYIGNVSGNVHGYSNNSYPVITTANLLDVHRYLSVTYYDNYKFDSLWYGSYAYSNDALSQTVNGVTYNQPSTASLATTGQITGTKVKVLDGGPTGGYTWLKTANYYDEKYRVIQTFSDNYKGGTDRISALSDFTGKVLKTKTTHTEFDVAWKDLYEVRVQGNKLVGGHGNQYDMGAVSAQQLPAGQDGWMEFTVTETHTGKVVGLSATNVNNGPSNMNYGFQLYYHILYIQEGGGGPPQAGSTTIQPGDVLRIERTGTTVVYKKNGQWIHTSPQPSNTSLMVDCSFHLGGNTIANVKTSWSGSSNIITRTFEYDHAGRLLKTWHQVNSDPQVLITNNEYNKLGQLVTKKLHSTDPVSTPEAQKKYRQAEDYRYNIRGWLTRMNNSDLSKENPADNTEPKDFFGMELGYNNSIGVGNDALFNGNISAMKWSNNLGLDDVKEKAYNYSYDAMNRITGATYQTRALGGDPATLQWALPAGSAFSERGYSYDLNGNIKSLTRKGAAGSNMDSLIYNYAEGTQYHSNKLMRVTDAGDDQTGFKEINTTSDDYDYDANGNMVVDRNKASKELLTNGSFDSGSSGWTITDPSNRLTFVDGRVEIVAGSSMSTLEQPWALFENCPHVMTIDIEKDAGDIWIMLGGTVVQGISTTGIITVTVTSANWSFKIQPQPNFVGRIRSVSVKGLTGISYNYLNLPENVTQSQSGQIQYIYDATGRKLSQVLYENYFNFKKKTDYAGEFVYEQSPDKQVVSSKTLYRSNFSEGPDRWEGTLGCSLQGNVDNIGEQNDCARMTLTSHAANQHFSMTDNVIPEPGQKYVLKADFYIPSSNLKFNGLKVTNSSGPQVFLDGTNIARDTWVTVESGPMEYTSGNRFYLRACNGTSLIFEGGIGEVGYMKNFRAKKVTTTSEQLMFINHDEGRIVVTPKESPAFNEAAYFFKGNTLDDSGNGHSGTAYGGASFGADRFGKASAILLDGVDDYVEAPDHAALDFGSGDFTVSYWVKKLTGTTGWSNVAGVCKWNTGGAPGTNEWSVGISNGINSNEAAMAVESGNTIYSVASGINLAIGQWHHIVGMRQGTSLKIYVDGVLKATQNIGTISINNAGRALQIGTIADPGHNTHGSFDDILIYRHALTDAEVTKLHLEGQNENEYQYNLKDHLGNVRLTFTTKRDVETFKATLEDNHISQESADFSNYNNITKSSVISYNHTAEAGATKSVVLNGAPNKQVGLTKSLKVLPGDTINMEVFAKYFVPGTSNPSGTAIAAAMTSAFGLSSSSVGLEQSAFQSVNGMFGSGWVLDEDDWEDHNAPKAFLNYILFDEDFIPYNMGFDQIDSEAEVTQNNPNPAHDSLGLQAMVLKPGYIYVYISNEDDEIVEVYFDDLKVEHVKSPVIQTDDYYPFGTRFNSFARENSQFNRKLYNAGSELQTDLDLNVYETLYRVYDPAIARWWQVDPLADHPDLVNWTPYNFGLNNPIRYNDPKGDFVFVIPIAIFVADVIITAAVTYAAAKTIQAGVNYTIQKVNSANTTTVVNPQTVTMPNGKVLPAPGTGKGSVPKELRDTKRGASAKEKQKMLDERGNVCEGCDKPVTAEEVDAHHVKRHADGGATSEENLVNLCPGGCHPLIHKQAQQQQPQPHPKPKPKQEQKPSQQQQQKPKQQQQTQQ